MIKIFVTSLGEFFTDPPNVKIQYSEVYVESIPEVIDRIYYKTVLLYIDGFITTYVLDKELVDTKLKSLYKKREESKNTLQQSLITAEISYFNQLLFENGY